MALLKTQKVVFGTFLTALLLSSAPALAADRDLINAALNSALDERANVTAEYKSNEAAERPENHFESRTGTDRMELTINGELNGGGGSLKSFDNPSRLYREAHIEAKLDHEVTAIDRDYAKTAEPKQSNEKSDGFQYSEATLGN